MFDKYITYKPTNINYNYGRFNKKKKKNINVNKTHTNLTKSLKVSFLQLAMPTSVLSIYL